MFFFFASSQWNDCRFLLITLLTTFLLLLFFTTCLYFTVHYSNSWGQILLRWLCNVFCFKFLFCENYKLFRSDGWHPFLTNTAKSHAINHGRKDVSSLQTSISENHHPPSLYWKHNDNHYRNAINRKLPSNEKYLDRLK